MSSTAAPGPTVTGITGPQGPTRDAKDQLVQRFAAMAHRIAEDLLDGDPVLPSETWIARKPLLVLGRETAVAVPEAYLLPRFDCGHETEIPAYRYAMALLAIDRKERALHALEQACRSSSVEWRDPFHLGWLLLRSGRAEDALPHLRRACELCSTSPRPFTWLGISLSKLGEHAGSVGAFKRASEINPDEASGWDNLAYAYHLAGDISNTREAAARRKAMQEAAACPGSVLTFEQLLGDRDDDDDDMASFGFGRSAREFLTSLGSSRCPWRTSGHS